MTRSKTKTFLISVLLAALAVCLFVAFAACKGGDKDKDSGKYGAGEEGIYYYDKDASTEYLMTLQSGTYMISADGAKGYSGTYSYDEDEKTVSFTAEDGEKFSAAFTDDVMQLEISGTPYTFLKKVDYTVKFMDGAAAVGTQSVTYGKSASKIDAEKDGYIFLGWYEDAAFTTQYKFNTAVTGDITLYAYYIAVDSSIPNFEVQFVSDGDVIYTTTTQNGVVYDIPEISGILGWWVSDTNDGNMLTYKYDGQLFGEATNLYAVSSNALGVSVYEKEITWEAQVSSVTITVDGTIVAPSATGNKYSYDMAALGTGKHTVEVSASGYGDETLVYVVNKLARVSNFAVYGTTLVYNAVENAQYYCIEVECGTPSHDHGTIYNGTSLTYDFSNCEMGPGGIKFTVYACANGYLESVSDTFVYALILDAVTVKIDSATDTASWNAVANAAGYEVYINGEYVGTVTDTEYSFKYEAQGAEIEIAVKPVAPGYWSETSTAAKYIKATLAAPEIISVSEYKISWTDVGAVSYELNINGNLISTEATEYLLSDTDKENISDVNMNAISVTAIGSAASENSQRSDIYYMTDKTMYSALTYADGVITWIYALAADSYVVSYEGATVTVAGVNTYDVTFTHSGENVIDVYFMFDGVKSAMAEISVTTYAVVFDSRGGRNVDTIYVAKGDRVYLETLADTDYELGMAEFKGWYTLPDLTADENASAYAGDGVEYVSGTQFDCNGTLVLYAFWINQRIEVTLYAGSTGEFEDDEGGSLGSVITSYISYGSKTYTLPVPVNPDGNTFFIGWYTAENGGIQYTDASGYATVLYNNTNVTQLYAHWGEALALDVTTYNGQKVLSVSAGKDISSMPGGVLHVAEEYEVDGTVYSVGLLSASAFNGCTKLTEINLPDTIQYISTVNGGYASGSGAFAGCTSLAAVNIYATDVGEEDTTKEIKYYSADGVLFEKDSSTDELTLIYYPHAKADKTYTVPSVVTNEAEYVLEGNSAVLSGGHPVTALATRVLSADSSTTSNRFQMTEVIIPASVRTVGSQCFYYSYNIEKIKFLEAGAGENASLTIEDYAFERCTNLTEITLPSHLSSFNMTMFERCSSLTEITITAGGTYSSTDGTDGTTKGLVCTGSGATIIYCSRYYAGAVAIGGGVTTIGEGAFEDCTKITSVEIGASVTLIEESAFEGCTGIESITFLGTANSGQMTIKTRAFYGLTNSAFTEITLPVNLTTLEIYAFGGCTKLVTVRFESYEGAVIDFATDAFANTAGNSYVESLYLGRYVPTIEFAGVFGKKLAYVEIDEDNEYYTTDEQGVVYDKEVQTVIYYPLEREGEYIIPGTVQTLGDNVFNGRTGMTYVYIPASVTGIGYQAFYGCTKLAEIEFELEGGTELVIADKAFYNCSALTTITLPSWLNAMGGYDQTTGKLISIDVFTGCNKLESIIIDGTYGTCESFMTSYGVLYYMQGGVPTDLILSPRQNSAAQGELVIPGTVSKIWYRAFYYNEGIEKISFENDTAENGLELDNQITYYSEVTEIVLPYGLETIPYECFYYTKSLEYVYIPYTVTKIDTYAFYGCTALATAEFGDVPEDLAAAGVEAEALEFGAYEYELGGYYFYGTAITELAIPDRTTSLHRSAFYGMTKLESVTIGAGLEEIPERCFFNDTKLTTVNFAENGNLKKIGEYAFTNTGALSLVMPSGLEEIADNAFSSYTDSSSYSTTSASAIVYVKFNKELESIGERAFASCKSLATIEFETPDVVDYSLSLAVGDNAFSYTVVTGVSIPYYMTTIAGFHNATSLKTVTFADTPEEYVFGTEDGQEGHEIVFGDYAFYSCSALTSLTIPWYISSIGSYAVDGNNNMASVTFDEAVHASLLTDIGANAFCNSSSFTQFVVPASVETIGANAFSTCTKLSTFEFALDENGFSSIKSIGKNAFLKTSLTSFVFPAIDTGANPDGIELGEGLFKQCTNLTTVTLSSGVTEIGSAFSYCYSITEIIVGEDSNFKNADDGSPVLYSADGLSIVFTYGEISGDLVIDEGVMEIADSIFMYQNTMTSVTIPSTATSIGESAFFGCTSLKSVYFAANADASKTSALTSIGKYAFAYCESLEEIDLPDSLTSIGPYTFEYCSSLKEITIPGGLELYDPDNSTAASKNYSYDFQYCTSLEKVVFAGVPNYIGSYAFYMCTSLATIGTDGTYTEGVADLSAMADDAFFGSYAFSGSGVKDVRLPATDFAAQYAGTSAMKYTFRECLSLENIVFSDSGSTSLCIAMFYGCTALETLVLNEHVSLLVGTSSASSNNGCSEFVGCTGLKTVITNGAMIQSYTFNGCTSLTTVADSQDTLAEGVAYLADNVNWAANSNGLYTFQGCISLSFVVLPDGCAVGQYMFEGCTGLKTVTTATKYSSGEYTEGVADLEGVSAIYTYAFSASGIENLIFPAISGDTDSAACIFMGCEYLKNITFSEGATTLNMAAFAGCTSLGAVVIPSNVSLTAGTSHASGNAKRGVFGESGVETILFWDTFSSIPDYTLWGCFNLTTLAQVSDANFDSDGNLKENTINWGIIDLTWVSSITKGYDFADCSSLTTVVYPSSNTSLATYEFNGCSSLTTFAVLEEGDDGSYDFSKIEYGVVDLSMITSVAAYLFAGCTSIAKVILPETVTSLSVAGVFDGCTSLVTVGETDGVADLTGLTALANYSFRQTGIKNLVLGGNTYSSTSYYAQFYECTELETITFTQSLNINKAMFAGCSALKEVVSEDGVVVTITAGTGGSTASTVTNKGAFCDCVSLETFDAAMAAISNYTFYNCTSLVNISLSSYDSVGTYVFYGCSSLESVDMPNATSVGTYAFYGCESLKTVTLPAVTQIANYTFYGCTSLEKVSISSAASLGTYAFYGCRTLDDVTISALDSIANYAFYDCAALGDINLSAVKSIGDYSFYGCLSLKEIDLSSATSVGTCSFYGSGLETLGIPAALDTIGAGAFGNCLSLSTITVDEGNNVYMETDGLIIDYVNSSVVFAAGATKDVVIPDGVTSIGDYAFYGFEGNTLTMSDDITYIGKYAFSYAYFDEIVLSGRLETIESYAFNFTMIESISIPASVTTIGDYAFSGDGSTSGTAANRIVVINGYSSLKAVTFEEYDVNKDLDGKGEQELSIGKYAFAASSLESVDLPDRLTEMGEGALLGTTYMTTISFGTGLTVLPNYVLAGSGIVNLDIPEWITEIGNNGGMYMENMETLTLHEGLEKLNQYCFMHAASLKTVTIPSTCTYVGTYCFSYSDSLESAVYEDGCTTMGVNQVFKNSPNFSSITLPESLEDIPTQCFVGTSVTSIIVPRNVESIGSTAFDGWDENCYIYLGYLSPYESIRLCGYATQAGSKSDFEAWREKCEGANIYYYSETEPTGEGAFEYWHYAPDGVTPVVW